MQKRLDLFVLLINGLSDVESGTVCELDSFHGMQPNRLVHNAILNFAVRAKSKGNANADIIKTGCDFFADDLVSEAKKTIWSVANYATRPSERLKVADTFADILKVLDYCDKNSVELPKFVIYEPDEVPTIPGEASATLTRKVNDLCLEFKNFVSMAKAQSLCCPSASSVPGPANPVTVNPQTSYAVVLKMPKSLDNPIARKQFLDTICPNSAEISELKKVRQDWKLFVKSKSSAEKIVEKMKVSKPEVSAMLKEKMFIAVLKKVPPSMTQTDIESLVPCALKAIEIGSFERSKVFKLYFGTSKDLEDFLAVSVRIGYEKLPAEEFKFLPKRCYSCHRVGHLATNCVLTPICGRCGASDHTSTKDNLCTKDMYCIICKKKGHTCYNIRCPANKAIINMNSLPK